MKDIRNFDIIIVGGSYAGLSAAMALGRALRSVLIIDSGKPCNRFTPNAHNLLTHDGEKPEIIREKSISQVLHYPSVQFLEGLVTTVKGEDSNFMVGTNVKRELHAKKIIFSTGVKDLLPSIEGLSDCWGKTVIHCPYCHGYEVRGKRTGILVNDESVKDFYNLIAHWTDSITIFTNGQPTFDTQELEKYNINPVVEKIQALQHKDGKLQKLVLIDGQTIDLDALYFRPPFEQHCRIPEALGCTLTESGHIEVNQFQQTSIKGIYAAGDCTTPFRSLSIAIAQGNIAGAMLNHDLIQEQALLAH